MSGIWLDPPARRSTVETMRRMIEAAQHDRDVARSMVRGRDDEIERLRAELDQEKQHSRSVERRTSEVLGYLAEAERLLREVSDTLRIENYFETADVIDAFLASLEDTP